MKKHFSNAEIMVASAQADWQIKSRDSRELASVIFSFSHPKFNHLVGKLNECSHTGGLLRLLQTMDYDNVNLVYNWVKSLIP
jgi:hypothetical protein